MHKAVLLQQLRFDWNDNLRKAFAKIIELGIEQTAKRLRVEYLLTE